MSNTTKFMGLLAGVSAVALIGVAVAQGVPPDARISNPAIGAGQQSSQHTAMGETGVYAWEKQMQTAVIPASVVTEPAPIIVQAEPAPIIVQAEPAPEPAPATTMGAAPAPEPMPAQTMAQAPVARADRN